MEAERPQPDSFGHPTHRQSPRLRDGRGRRQRMIVGRVVHPEERRPHRPDQPLRLIDQKRLLVRPRARLLVALPSARRHVGMPKQTLSTDARAQIAARSVADTRALLGNCRRHQPIDLVACHRAHVRRIGWCEVEPVVGRHPAQRGADGDGPGRHVGGRRRLPEAPVIGVGVVRIGIVGGIDTFLETTREHVEPDATPKLNRVARAGQRDERADGRVAVGALLVAAPAGPLIERVARE